MWPKRLQRALRRALWRRFGHIEALERIWRQCGRNVSRELSRESGDNVAGTSPGCSQGSPGDVCGRIRRILLHFPLPIPNLSSANKFWTALIKVAAFAPRVVTYATAFYFPIFRASRAKTGHRGDPLISWRTHPP